MCGMGFFNRLRHTRRRGPSDLARLPRDELIDTAAKSAAPPSTRRAGPGPKGDIVGRSIGRGIWGRMP